MTDVLFTGTVLSLENDKAYVFTSGCEMVAIWAKKSYAVGSEICFTHNDLYIQRRPVLPLLRKFAPAIAVLLVLAGSLGLFLHFLADAPGRVLSAVVSVDINPGVELALDGEGRILEASPRNEDGDILLRSVEVTDLPLEEGLRALCRTARELGYLRAGNNLVLVTAALSNGKASGSEDYKNRLRDILGAFELNYTEADILTVLAEDPDIIREARNNDLTLGKELLYRYARAAETDLSADYIRHAGLSELVDVLGVRTTDGSLNDTLIRQAGNSPGTETTALTTAVPAATVSAPDTTAATEPAAPITASASTTATPVVTTTAQTTAEGRAYNLSVSVSGSRLLFSWTPLQTSSVNLQGTQYSGFKYYKVVASETNASPVYPEDGYLYAGSDRGTSGWSADVAKGDYNTSPELVPGRSYYFSLTYVFENGKFSSNTVRVTLPGTSSATTPAATTTGFGPPLLSVTGSGSSLLFVWTGLPGDAVSYGGKSYSGFLYYKVVASETNASPMYPEDGYLYAGSDRGKFSWKVDPAGDGYNPSPLLIPGRSYYFAVTYVFENGKFSSNTVLHKLPGTEASEGSTTASAGFGPPALSASVSGNVLNFLWTPLPGASVTWQGKQYNSFQYYKVVASETNPSPVYPDDGYLYVETDRTVSGWSVDITKSNYNKSPVLTAGKSYYFSVTYVFDNGKFSSGTVQIKLPG